MPERGALTPLRRLRAWLAVAAVAAVCAFLTCRSEVARDPRTTGAAPEAAPRGGTPHALRAVPRDAAPAPLERWVIRVRATDADGRAIPGAEARVPGRSSRFVSRAGADAGGVATLDLRNHAEEFALPGGAMPTSVFVDVRAPGFHTVVERAPLGSETQVRLERGLAITARVVLKSSGAPVAGAHVIAASDDQTWRDAADPSAVPGDAATLRTDGAGTVALAAPPPGAAVNIVAWADGLAPQALRIAPGASGTQELVLDDAAGLAGVVRRDDGGPLAGRVYLVPSGDHGALLEPDALRWATHAWATVGPDGAFSVRGVAEGGAWRVVALLADGARGAAECPVFAGTPARQIPDVSCALPVDASLQFLGAEGGRALAPLSVTVRPDPEAGISAFLWAPRVTYGELVVVGPVGAGTWRVTYAMAGTVSAEASIEVHPTAPRVALRVAEPAAWTFRVRGRLPARARSPRLMARVRAAAGDPWNAIICELDADRTGTIQFPGAEPPMAEFRSAGSVESWTPWSRGADGAMTVELPAPWNVTVRGTAPGRPAERIVARAETEDGATWVGAAETGTDGAAVLQLPPAPGTWFRFERESDGAVARRAFVSGPDPGDVVDGPWELPGRRTWCVTDGAGGAVVGAKVAVGRSAAQGVTGTDGRCSLPAEPGWHRIDAPGWPPHWAVARDADAELVVRLSRANLRVRATRAGRPLRGVRVDIAPTDGGSPRGRAAATGLDGEAAFPLPSGRYRVSLEGEGDAREADLEDGDAVTLQFELR